jgi:hypothetical protein
LWMRRTSTYASSTESDCGRCYNQQRNRRAEISAEISKENADSCYRSSALTQRAAANRRNAACRRQSPGMDCTEIIDSTVGYSKAEWRRHSAFGIRLMRSLGVPEGQRKPPVKSRHAGLRKIDNFLPRRLAVAIVFQNDRSAPAGASHRRRGTGTLALETGNDSEMAPQAIEIAKNGLGDRCSAPML